MERIWRAIGTTFIMGEGWAEPTCEGYEFIGWKLKNKDGKLSQKTYSNGELFTISDENYGYANNTNLPVFASKNYTGYQKNLRRQLQEPFHFLLTARPLRRLRTLSRREHFLVMYLMKVKIH